MHIHELFIDDSLDLCYNRFMGTRVPNSNSLYGKVIEMKRNHILRTVSGGLALLMTILQMPVVPTDAEEQLAMRISKLNVSESEIGENRLLSVDVLIEGNEKGFLAAEFGVAYDTRLALQSITPCCKAAESFVFNSTSENHMIWFSGANVNAESGATKGRTQLFKLDFVLPQDYSVGDDYVITYEWNGVDGSPAFWYTDKTEDAVDSLMAYSRTGSISIPSPDAPRLSKNYVELNPFGTVQLNVENASADGMWFSDNERVATVENGVITGVAPGSCVISVFLSDSSSFLSCDVTVRNEFIYSMFDTEPVRIFAEDQIVKLEYPNPVGSTSWISTNTNVVTVDDGILKAIGNGTAQIIATNNGVSKMKMVTVQLGETPEPTQPTTKATKVTTTTTSTTITTTTEPTTSTTTTTTTEPTTSTTTTTTTTQTTTTMTTATTQTTTTAATAATQTTTEPTQTMTVPKEPFELGDADGSGIINANDATVILIAAARVGTGQGTGMDPEKQKAADVNHDGYIDANDAVTVLRYAAAIGVNIHHPISYYI